MMARKVHNVGDVWASDQAQMVLHPELTSPSSTVPFPHPAPTLKALTDLPEWWSPNFLDYEYLCIGYIVQSKHTLSISKVQLIF